MLSLTCLLVNEDRCKLPGVGLLQFVQFFFMENKRSFAQRVFQLFCKLTGKPKTLLTVELEKSLRNIPRISCLARTFLYTLLHGAG